jgi:hypothetical protein
MRARCVEWRAALRVRGDVAESEIAAYWPGGPENPEPPRSIGAWIYCALQLARFFGRTEAREAYEAAPERNAEAQAAALAALRAEPVPVELVAREADGSPVVRHVHPKSFLALLELTHRTRCIGALVQAAEHVAVQAVDGDAAALELLDRVHQELAYQYRLLAWIATTPGPGLPYEETTPTPVLPDGPAFTWLHALDALDYYRLALATQQANAERLALVQGMLTPDTDGGPVARPSFGSLFVGYAEAKHVPPRAVMRDWSLAEVVTDAQLQAEAHRAARAGEREDEDDHAEEKIGKPAGAGR